MKEEKLQQEDSWAAAQVCALAGREAFPGGIK